MLILLFLICFPLLTIQQSYHEMLEPDLPRFCHHAAVTIEGEDVVCSGAIISSTEIVTSFECFDFQKMSMNVANNVYVRVGSMDRLSGGIFRRVSDVKRIYFPQSDQRILQNVSIPGHSITFDCSQVNIPGDPTSRDMALLTLKEPLPIGPTICPIELARKEDDIYVRDKTIVEVSGYASAKNSTILHWIESPIDIDEIYGELPSYFIKIPRESIFPKLEAGKINSSSALRFIFMNNQ